MRQSTIKELDTPKLKAVLKKCVQFSDLLNSFKDAYFNVVLGNLFQKLGAASPFFFNLPFGTTKSFPPSSWVFFSLRRYHNPNTWDRLGCILFTWAKNGRSTVWEIVSKIRDKFRPGIAVATWHFSAGTAQKVVYHLLSNWIFSATHL